MVASKDKLRYLSGQSLSKNERLCLKTLIDELFTSGQGFKYKYLPVVWKLVDTSMDAPAQIMFSVPKRYFKKANKRNLIKRRMKEIYRKNKLPLYDLLHENDKNMIISMSYQTKEIHSYETMEKDVKKTLAILFSKIEKEFENFG